MEMRYRDEPIGLKFLRTDRGFARYNFMDLYSQPCSLQASSLATEDAIWLGCDESRMHLTREDVAALIPVLQQFVDGGDIEPTCTAAGPS